MMIWRLLIRARDGLDSFLTSPSGYAGVPEGMTREQLIRELTRERQHSLDLEKELETQEVISSSWKRQLDDALAHESEQAPIRKALEEERGVLQAAVDLAKGVIKDLSTGVTEARAKEAELAAQLQDLIQKARTVLQRSHSADARATLARTVAVLEAKQ
jgi:hypothetical protein